MGALAFSSSIGIPVQEKILGKKASLLETGPEYNLYEVTFDNGHKLSIEERNYPFEGICFFINAATEGIHVRAFINPSEIDGKQLTRDIFEYTNRAPKMMPDWARALEDEVTPYPSFPWPANKTKYLLNKND